MNKKSEIMIGIVLLAVIGLFFIGWLITLSKHECNSDAQCGFGYYCGSDFACHAMPVIEKRVVSNNLVAPALIIGLAIILAAIVLRWSQSLYKKQH